MKAADRVHSFLQPALPTLRLLVPALLLSAIGPVPAGAPEPVDATPAGITAPSAEDELASVRREVRLRKLHLVRPDLIQYPLSYDVYC